jgi:hypothetical protein
MAELTIDSIFARAVFLTVRRFKLKNVLEIGSFDGDGSTQVLISAMKPFRNKKLTCLETKKDRAKNLRANTNTYSWVVPVCQSSISWESFTLRNFDRDIWKFYGSNDPALKARIRSLWDHDILEMQAAGCGFLEMCKEHFDAALLDGGVFTGYDELRLLREKTDCFMLDDVFKGFKNKFVHSELKKDPAWVEIFKDQKERLGTSIFIRKTRLGKFLKNHGPGLKSKMQLALYLLRVRKTPFIRYWSIPDSN